MGLFPSLLLYVVKRLISVTDPEKGDRGQSSRPRNALALAGVLSTSMQPSEQVPGCSIWNVRRGLSQEVF